MRLFASKTKPNASQICKDACLANTLLSDDPGACRQTFLKIVWHDRWISEGLQQELSIFLCPRVPKILKEQVHCYWNGIEFFLSRLFCGLVLFLFRGEVHVSNTLRWIIWSWVGCDGTFCLPCHRSLIGIQAGPVSIYIHNGHLHAQWKRGRKILGVCSRQEFRAPYKCNAALQAKIDFPGGNI